jgi:hypothetical protein
MTDGAAPEAEQQQQWQVPAWDPTDAATAEHDPDHVEVSSVDSRSCCRVKLAMSV